jgi:thiol-disulfide isomerase/thioredoxin
MKKSLLITLGLLISEVLFGQPGKAKKIAADPFCKMIETIYKLDALSFNSQYNMKQVFETDTITAIAKVIVKKNGTAVSFLQIIPENGDKELLFVHDSAWVVDHNETIMSYIGTNTESLTYNSMAQFFPFSLFNLDTAISQVEPFWKVTELTNEYTVISLDITNSSKDLTDIRVEFTIGNSDFLPYKTLQESVYLKADKQFQEQIFSGYSFPVPGQVKVPAYFSEYEKDIGQGQKIKSATNQKEDEQLGEIFLKDIELYNLDRNPFTLPDKGLILFDLWYVGCPPCMKSAPVVEKLYSEYKGSVHFFSINETDRDTSKIIRFSEKMGITFPVLLGGREKLALKINGRSSYPLFILMEAESGKVVWKMEGFNDNLEELLRNAINQNL